IASWAQGEVDVVDLQNERLIKRILHKGILPHMFNMAYNPLDGLLYIPKGTTAVNGSFGAALSVLNPATEKMDKIYTGWAPIDLVAAPEGDGVLVFNNEDAFARIRTDGSFTLHRLPVEYPIAALRRADGDIYLSYGAHQSYWPTVYIWDAKNGILRMNPKSGIYYDRRIPRQAHQIVEDRDGVLYFLQNSWGREEQFLGLLPDGVRDFDIGRRIRLKDELERETVPRLLRYDPALHCLYAARVGDKDDASGLLHVINLDSHKVAGRVALGNNPTDMCFDDHAIYITDFAANTITRVDKNTYATQTLKVGRQPLRLAAHEGHVYALCHAGKSLHDLSTGAEYQVPTTGRPNALIPWRGKLVVAAHAPNTLQIFLFDAKIGRIKLLHEQTYPYGDTRFDSGNVSFYLQGQYGDAVFHLIRGLEDDHGRLWLSDFIAGKVYLIEE
ncbi:hypothetical protein JXO59_16085, partial [candidate division KSB1 bacterium]|nr:hypothetical protein [candidate division KSB1 bacterium]